MGRLVYSAITSLDGYVEDAEGHFDWAAPDEEVHAFVNDQERRVGINLYGRRMYEVMSWWENVDLEGEPAAIREYAEIWRAADKIVYSRTLDKASTARTRIERDFDSNAVRGLKETSPRDLSIGGPELAASAIKAGLVDEYHVFLTPVVVGGGKHWLPPDIFLKLELTDQHRFGNGVVHLGFRAAPTDR